MGVFGQIRKRDDRIVPFDPRKLVDALYRALCRAQSQGRTRRASDPEFELCRDEAASRAGVDTANDPLAAAQVDHALARELGAAVVHFAYERFGERIPSTAAVVELVEAALMETGRVDVARAFARYGEARARLRDTLEVCQESLESPHSPETAAAPEAVAPVQSWDKQRIVQCLIGHAGFDERDAAEVAASVEERVMGTGLSTVSVALLRALVNAELQRRGSPFRLRTRTQGDNVTRVLANVLQDLRPRTPAATKNAVAESLLTDYSLSEIHSPVVRDAYEAGRIHLHALGDPLRLPTVVWDLPEPLSSAAFLALGEVLADNTPPNVWPEIRNADRRPTSFLDLREFIERVDTLRQYVSDEVRLRLPNRLLRDRALDALSEDTAIRRVLDRLVSDRQARPAVALEIPLGETSEAWLEALLDLWRTGQRDALPLRVWIDPAHLLEVGARRPLALVAELHSRSYPIRFKLIGAPGTLDSTIDLDGSDGAVLASVGCVTLNLPQVAYRSGRRQSGGNEAELDATLDLAVKALLERRRFLVSMGAHRGHPLWEILGRSRDAQGNGFLTTEALGGEIGVVGLAESVKFLTGYEVHDNPRAAERARAIVRQIARRLDRDGRTLGIHLSLVETMCPATIARLETLDRERHTASVAEVDRGRASTNAGELRVYSSGVRLHEGALVDHARRLRHLVDFSDSLLIEDLLLDVPALRGESPDLIAALLGELAGSEAARASTHVSGDDQFRMGPAEGWQRTDRRPDPSDSMN